VTVSTRTALRTLPRPVWALILGTFLNRFGSFVYIFLVLYMTARGYTAPQAGLAVGAYGAGSLGASLLGGRLADHVGRRNTIVLSMCGSAVSMLALSQAQGLFPIILLASASGLASELYRPASSALIADLLPEEQWVTGYGIYRLAVNTGVAIGPAVAGLLFGHSFFLLFLGDAVTSVLFAILAVVALPNHIRSAHDQMEGAASGAEVARATRMRYDSPFLWLLAATALTSFVYVQSDTTLALQVRAIGLSALVYGGLLSLNAALIIAIELPLTSYTRRIAPHLAMALGSILIALGFGFTAFASTVGLLACSVVIWTFGEMTLDPVRQAYVASLAPAHLRGRYMGAVGFTQSLGQILASVLGTLLFTVNAQWFWLLCGLLGITAAAIVAGTQRPQPRAPAERGEYAPETASSALRTP
jgi:MFS family permease